MDGADESPLPPTRGKELHSRQLRQREKESRKENGARKTTKNSLSKTWQRRTTWHGFLSQLLW